MIRLLQQGFLLILVIQSSALLYSRPIQLNADLARSRNSRLPIIINTWAFKGAAHEAWHVLKRNKPALDAVEAGCSQCELAQCDGTVGFGGSPDELGETTLDAMIMNGDTMEVGAVASLRHVKHAITAARLVMERTRHSMLAGVLATQFAQEMGLSIGNLTTNKSSNLHKKW